MPRFGRTHRGCRSSIGRIGQRGLYASIPPIDQRQEDAVRLARVLRAAERFVRLGEGHGPDRSDQSRGEMGVRIIVRAPDGVVSGTLWNLSGW